MSNPKNINVSMNDLLALAGDAGEVASGHPPALRLLLTAAKAASNTIAVATAADTPEPSVEDVMEAIRVAGLRLEAAIELAERLSNEATTVQEAAPLAN